MGKNESKLACLPLPHRPGTYRSLSLYTATYNVADQAPCSDNLASFCGVDDKLVSLNAEKLDGDKTNNDLPDIIALGLQEQEKSEEWIERMKQCLVPHGYCAIKYRKLWSISLIVFMKYQHLEAVQNIESEVTRSGVGDIMGDKGAVSIRFDIYGINMILVCAHLSAHLHENKERVSDFWDIVSNQRFRDPDVDKILDHDFIFWMGDLNFRIDDIPNQEVIELISQGHLAPLLLKDQLKSTIVDSGIFDEFEEGDITFDPTFKFDLNTDIYDTSKKQRKPAWTDRVLYKSNQAKLCEKNITINLLEYSALPQYKYSDHRPVFGRFRLTVPGTPPADPVQFIDWSLKKKESHSCVQAVVRYRILRREDPKFQAKAGDTIRLYKLPFSDFEDVVVRANAAVGDSGLAVETLQVKLRINSDSITEEDWLMVAYWSVKKNCPATCSSRFQLPTCSDE